MMAVDELDDIMFTVAGRFGWDYLLIEAMPIKKLIKWYRGAERLYKVESGVNGKQTDNVS